MDLNIIKELLLTQDNRITADPIFAVQQRKRIYGFDSDYSDYYVWINHSDEEADEETAKELDDLSDWEYSDKAAEENWTKLYYQDHWEFVTACFTEQACKDYIARNAHNLGPTRIYVYSAYKNEEWRLIRSVLMEENKDEQETRTKTLG